MQEEPGARTESVMHSTAGAWPPLELARWQGTYEALHLWSQVVGKIRLAQTPWLNHSWHVPLYATATGLTTSAMPYGDRTFTITFDLTTHQLRIETNEGAAASIGLEPMSVATFYGRLMHELEELGIFVKIWPMPVEIPGDVTPFSDDHTTREYDPDHVTAFWQVLLQVHRVFTEFRSRFIGKSSPVHFFWGAFDLAATRFSGRTAPKHPGGAPNCADWVMEEAYSHELFSIGFWPGAGLGEAAFYAYAYPEPKGFSEASVRPDAAYYHSDLGEYVLPYEAVRLSRYPEAMLLEFCQSTYEVAASLAGWDRNALERRGASTGQPKVAAREQR